MQPLRTYEYLVKARQRVLDWARPLPVEAHGREFAIGPGTLRRVLTHMLISEWYYVERMLGNAVPEYAKWPIKDETPPMLAEIEAEWAAQAVRTRAALASIRDWDARLQYEVTADLGEHVMITATPADIFTQLALHEVHHRAQAMNMLRQLGVKAEDIDFNTLMYTRTPIG